MANFQSDRIIGGGKSFKLAWDSLLLSNLPFSKKNPVKATYSNEIRYIARIPTDVDNFTPFIGCLTNEGSFNREPESKLKQLDRVEILVDPGKQTVWLEMTKGKCPPPSAYAPKQYFEQSQGRIYIGSCSHGIGVIKFDKPNWKYVHVVDNEKVECSSSTFKVLCVRV